MSRLALSILLTFLIMNLATFVAYGSMAALVALQPPEDGTPGELLLSVLLVKIGMAAGFVLLFRFGGWRDRWPLYAFTWWLMFAIIEIGQAVGPNYSALDAVGGIIAEAIYFPVSAAVASRLLRPSTTQQP